MAFRSFAQLRLIPPPRANAPCRANCSLLYESSAVEWAATTAVSSADLPPPCVSPHRRCPQARCQAIEFAATGMTYSHVAKEWVEGCDDAPSFVSVGMRPAGELFRP